ncbi:MAG: response regulator transcription factor [Anaerolineae bacterium]|nr:MAG: response regulator transcription factor [Anaerolineae bacterium]
MDDLRVLVIADDPLARTGLATLLADQSKCTVVGQTAGDAELLAELDVYRPDVLVWDLGWDPALALDRLADLSDGHLPVVALLADDAYAAEAWLAGARGLLLRDTDPDSLATALQAVTQGLVVLDPSLSAALLSVSDRMPGGLFEELTARELEVLQLLAEGLPNKAIAQQLSISEHTVKFHVNAILGKLSAQSRTEAVVRATRLGLIVL